MVELYCKNKIAAIREPETGKNGGRRVLFNVLKPFTGLNK
jgi:hypothetical protein